jgi:hypothetical protein
MNIDAKPISEISRRAAEILFQSMGVVDTLRFFNQFSTGHGDYTKDREQWLDCFALDEAISRIKEARESR